MKLLGLNPLQNLAALGVLLSLGACNNNNSGGTSSVENLAPVFGGVQSVMTAGGARILLTWDQGTDDQDDVADLRYQVFLSATPGGHDFGAPVLTTAPGATRVQLTSTHSALIAIGSEVFAVVRALDSHGATDPNTAESPVTCVAAASVAYVDGAAAGPGTLNDPSDPFPTLQGGFDAVPAAGGAVLVAEGVHTDLAALTATGDVGSTVAVVGSFPSASFTAGATAESLLAAYAPDTNATIIDGVGVDPTGVVGQVGHLDVRNNGRPTQIAGLTFRDDEAEILLGGVDVDLTLTDCRFLDTNPNVNATPVGVSVNVSVAGAFSQRMRVAGCFFDELFTCIALAGDVIDIRAGACRAEDCSQFLTGTITIPATADFVVHLANNDVTRMSGAPVQMIMVPEVDHGAGSIELHILDNRFAACAGGIDFEDFGQHGADRCELLVERNHFGPGGSNAIDFKMLPGTSSDDEFIAAETIDIAFRGNDFVHFNTDMILFSALTPGEGAELTFEVDDCTFVQCDNVAIDSDPSFPGTATFSQDGTTQTTVLTNLVSYGCDGFVEWDQSRFRAGESSLRAENCLALGTTDEGFDIVMRGVSTNVTSAVDPIAIVSLMVEGCEASMGDDSSPFEVDFRDDAAEANIWASICNNKWVGGKELDFDFDSSDSRGYLVFAHNEIGAATEGRAFRADMRGPGATWSGLIARNQIVGGGDDSEEGLAINIYSEVAGADLVVRNNLIVGTGDGLSADHRLQGVQMINNTIAFTGEGPLDTALGSTGGGLNSGVYVLNGVSHGNREYDIPNETFAHYTAFEFPAESAGIGCWPGDPVFAKSGSLIDVNEWFQLAAYSPCVDAGQPGEDFLDPDGTRGDMGAFGGPGAGRLGALETPATPTPFFLVGVDPLLDLYAGAVLIGTADDVTVVFNSEVNSATVSASTLAFEVSGTAVAGNYVTSGRKVTFTPTGGWTNAAQVRLVMTTGLTSVDGESLAHRHARWFAITPSTTDAESEANNSLGTANALGSDAVERMGGDLASDADLDFFSFTGAFGERLQVSLLAHRLNPATTANFGLRLYDPSGVAIYENSYGMPDEDPFIEYTLPESGVYTIEVFDEASGAGAGPFAWEMEVWRR
ncbi:MAG: hypothetical protein GY930_06750 [bacterium]|nr:hypothetical protein [bacterium]